MAVLVSYGSSDDEDEIAEQTLSNVESTQAADRKLSEKEDAPSAHDLPEPTISSPENQKNGDAIHQSAVPLGPARPPPSADSQPPFYAPPPGPQDIAGPSSPHAANRALLQDLTLPAVPDMDIPPSPPGSPPAALTKKLEQFLTLKAQGVHLNARLEQSHGLKNPGAMDKLLGFVGINGSGEYETVLGTDLYDPGAFAPEKYRAQLRKEHARISKEREAEKLSGTRTSVDFVPPSTSRAG